MTLGLFLPVRRTDNNFRIRFLFIVTIIGLIVGEILIINIPDHRISIGGWYHVISASFSFTILAMIIREYRPVYSRNPSLFVYLPILIIPAYLLIHEINVLSNLLNIMLQGGVLLVTSLLFFVFINKINNSYKMLGGIILMLISFISFWFIPESQESYLWLLRISFGIAVILLGYSFNEILTRLNTKEI